MDNVYVIVMKTENNTFYLNHAYLNSMDFGSEDMAWTTNDLEKARLMLFKIKTKKRQMAEFLSIETI